MSDKIYFGEYLVLNKKITKEERNAALEKQKASRSVSQYTQFGNVILSLGILSEEEVCQELTGYFGSARQFKAILNYRPTADVAMVTSVEHMYKLKTIPIHIDKDAHVIELATIAVTKLDKDSAKTAYSNLLPGCSVTMYDVLEQPYVTLINKIAELQGSTFKLNEIEVTASEKLSQIYRDAINMGASDIHIYPDSKKVHVRFRVARDLVEYKNVYIPYDLRDSINRTVCIQASIPEAELKAGQKDFKISDVLGDDKYTSRGNFQQTIHGYALTFRLIPKFVGDLNIDSLNLSPNLTKCLKDTRLKRNGLILVTGPQGSGKNHTMAGFVCEINDGSRYIVTIEDPVEQHIDNVNQIPIDSKTTSFGKVAKSVVRQDCDVLQIGEIRDPESLEVAIQGGLEGMLVISTLHTSSCGEVFPRLESIDSDAYRKAVSAIDLIINQKLVRKLCPNCRKLITRDELTTQERYALDHLSINGHKVTYGGKLYKAQGCDQCLGHGYKRAVVCSELIKLDKPTKNHLIKLQDSLQAEVYIRDLMLEQKSLVAFDGFRRLSLGEVDLISLLKEDVIQMEG